MNTEIMSFNHRDDNVKHKITLQLMDSHEHFSKMGYKNKSFQLKCSRKFDSNDGVYVPINEGNSMMCENNFVVKLYSKNSNKYVYGKAIGYDAPKGKIVAPKWMREVLNLSTNDNVDVIMVKIEPIIGLKISSPKVVVDPQAILEFELSHRNILSSGDVISSKIFEKKYNFIVKEIQTRNGISNVGSLYDNGVIADINFEIDHY